MRRVVMFMWSSQRHKRDRSQVGESTKGWAWSDALNRKAPPRRIGSTQERSDKPKGSSSYWLCRLHTHRAAFPGPLYVVLTQLGYAL
jgi:hypothetical protein